MILKLSSENISLLVKQDEQDKEKIKVRLFNTQLLKAGFIDAYISLWEFNESFLLSTIDDCYNKLNENIKIQKQINENRQRAKQRTKKTDFEETFFG